MSSHHHICPIHILSIGADEHDHAFLANILAHPGWVVIKARDLAAARSALEEQNVSVILCHSDSTPEPWTEILDTVQQIQHPAPVVITSRLADDHLWSAALHHGAWDVLAKPFRAPEVVRSLRYAWEHWRHEQRLRPAAKAMTASG